MGTKSELLGKIIKGGEALTEYAQGLLKFGEEGMTQEARLQRAKDMGFDTDTVYYHGTNANIDEFIPTREGYGEIGGGVYLTKDPSQASSYAMLNRGGENVLPVNVAGGDIFDFSTLDNKSFDEIARMAGISDVNEIKEAYKKTGDINKYLEQAGYKGAIDANTLSGSNQLVMFNPSDIRSVNANFDPDKKDSSNLLASIGAGVGTAGLVGAGMTPEEAEASFIGKAAKTFSQEAYQLAKKMEAEGASRDEIWKATGMQFNAPMMRGPEGKWRQEIDDKPLAMSMNDLELDRIREEGFLLQPTRTLFRNKPLNQAYPELDPSLLIDRDRPRRSGAYSRDMDRIESSLLNNRVDESVMSHELQHAIQDIEGFSSGGNPSYLSDDEIVESFDEIDFKYLAPIMEKYGLEVYDMNTPKEAMNALAKDAKKAGASPVEIMIINDAYKIAEQNAIAKGKKPLSGYEKYQRLAGEAEARNVETRLNYTMDDRINTPPWKTLDVPEDELIVRVDTPKQASARLLADRTTGATGIATAPKNTLTAGIARGVNELGRRQDPVTKVALDLEELGNSYTNLGYGTAGIGDLLPVAEFLPFAAKGLGLASRAFPAVLDAIGMSSDDGLSDEAVAEYEAYKRRLLEQ